jgi:hypothetical protein
MLALVTSIEPRPAPLRQRSADFPPHTFASTKDDALSNIDTYLTEACARQDRFAPRRFKSALPASQLFLAYLSDQPVDANGNVPAGARLSLVQFETDKGETYPVMFTSPAAAQSALPEPHLLFPADTPNAFVKFAGAPGIEIRGTNGACRLTAREVEALCAGKPISLPAGTDGPELSEPSVEPTHLLNPIRDFCAARGSVKAAYRMRGEDADGGEMLYLGVETSEPEDDIWAALKPVIDVARYETDGIQIVSMAETDALSHFLKTYTTPFYKRRKLFGLF